LISESGGACEIPMQPKSAGFLQAMVSEEVLAMRRPHDKEQRSVRWQVPNELVSCRVAMPRHALR